MGDSQIIIYQTESGLTKIDVRLENETVWLTQKAMAELFQTTMQNITIHLKNIFQEGELQKDATCKDFLQVQKEGTREVNRNLEYYNLDAIISFHFHTSLKGSNVYRKTAFVHQATPSGSYPSC